MPVDERAKRQEADDVGGLNDHQEPGDPVAIHAAAPTAKSATWELWRLGYYGGKGGRHMLKLGPFAGEEQPVPLMGMGGPLMPMRDQAARWT